MNTIQWVDWTEILRLPRLLLSASAKQKHERIRMQNKSSITAEGQYQGHSQTNSQSIIQTERREYTTRLPKGKLFECLLSTLDQRASLSFSRRSDRLRAFSIVFLGPITKRICTADELICFFAQIYAQKQLLICTVR